MEENAQEPEGERRANPRLNRLLGVEVRQDGKFQKQFVADISATGFRMVTVAAPPAQEPFAVRLHLTHGPVVEGTARIVWCQRLALPGLVHCGCAFDELASEKQLREMLDFIDRHLEKAHSHPPLLGLAERFALGGLTEKDIVRLTVLQRVSHLLGGPLPLSEVLDRVVSVVVEVTGAERGFLVLDRGGHLEAPVAHTGSGAKPTLDFSHSLVRAVMKSGVPLLSIDATKDERLVRSSSLKVLGVRSILCVPLKSDDRSLGILYLDNRVKTGAFTSLDLQLAVLMAELAALSIDRAERLDGLVQQEKDSALKTMLEGLRYELAGPLQALTELGGSLDDTEGAESWRKEVDRCRRTVEKLAQLMSTERPERSRVDLCDVVAGTFPRLRKDFSLGGIRLVLDLPPTSVIVIADPEQLEQMVVHLLINARKAVEPNPGEVEVALRATNQSVLLTVTDGGRGVATEDQGRIFDPYFTTRRREGDLGLGLTFVRKVARDHGGHVEVRPRATGGTAVTVVLRAEQEACKPAAD